jgi:aryl-phospho-beta-D-glucosidase BglC (GH1 family)
VLRGFNRNGLEAADNSNARNVTLAEVEGMRAWGANVVRIPVNQAPWTQVCASQYDPTYEPYIDQVVDWVTGAGMVAIIDLHDSTGSTCGPEGPHSAPDAGSVAFWKDAAAHYASNPLVAFELFNEPHVKSGTPGVWLHGQQTQITDAVQTSPGHWTRTSYVPLGEQQLYDAVEGTGARNLVIIDADHYASDPKAITTGRAVRDYNDNIVYAVHPYQCTASSASACMDDPAMQQANTVVLDRFRAVAATYPVFASEFGWPDNSAAGATFMTNTFAYLEAQSPAWGFAVFAWDGRLGGGFHVLSTLAPTWRANITGRAVRQELATH